MAPKKKTERKNSKKPIRPPQYNREWLIDQHISTISTETGISKSNSLKELRGMLGEESPDEDLDVSISFVEIVGFTDENQAIVDYSTKEPR